MKKTLYVLSFALIAYLFQAAALSQISITSADETTAFAAGKSLFGYSSSDTVLMNIGSASSSAAQSWTAPSVKINDSLRLDGVAPSSTPYSANFPAATYAQIGTIKQGPMSIAFYEYYKLSTDTLIALGGVQHIKGSSGDVTIDSTAIKTTPQTQLVFPVHLGQSVAHQTDTIYSHGTDVETETETDSYDAYGTLNLPNGSYGALRQTGTIVTKVYLSGSLVNTITSYIVTWLTESGNELQVQLDTLSTGSVRVHSITIYYVGTTPATLVKSSLQLPENFTLSQNYPNPFNPSTQILFSVAQAGFVSLKVYDMIGREVATLVNQELTPSSYSITWNAANVASGVYLYRLVSGSYTETKKMVLMK